MVTEQKLNLGEIKRSINFLKPLLALEMQKKAGYTFWRINRGVELKINSTVHLKKQIKAQQPTVPDIPQAMCG